MIRINQVYFSKGNTAIRDGTPVPLGGRFRRLQSDHYPCCLSFVVNVSLFVDNVSKTYTTLQIRVTQGGSTVYQTGKLFLPIDGEPDPSHPDQFAYQLEDIAFGQPGSYFVEIVINGETRYLKALTLI